MADSTKKLFHPLYSRCFLVASKRVAEFNVVKVVEIVKNDWIGNGTGGRQKQHFGFPAGIADIQKLLETLLVNIDGPEHVLRDLGAHIKKEFIRIFVEVASEALELSRNELFIEQAIIVKCTSSDI